MKSQLLGTCVCVCTRTRGPHVRKNHTHTRAHAHGVPWPASRVGRTSSRRSSRTGAGGPLGHATPRAPCWRRRGPRGGHACVLGGSRRASRAPHARAWSRTPPGAWAPVRATVCLNPAVVLPGLPRPPRHAPGGREGRHGRLPAPRHLADVAHRLQGGPAGGGRLPVGGPCVPLAVVLWEAGHSAADRSAVSRSVCRRAAALRLRLPRRGAVRRRR